MQLQGEAIFPSKNMTYPSAQNSAKKWLQRGLYKQNKDGKDFMCATAEEKVDMVANCIKKSRTKQGKMLKEKSFQNIFSSVATVSHIYNVSNSVSMIWVILPFCSFVLRNNFLVSISKIWNHIAIKLGCYEIYRLDTRKYEKYRLGRLPQRGPCRPRRYFSYFLGLVSIFHIILVWKRYIPYFLV